MPHHTKVASICWPADFRVHRGLERASNMAKMMIETFGPPRFASLGR